MLTHSMMLAPKSDVLPAVRVDVRDRAPERSARVGALIRQLGAELARVGDDAALIVCAEDIDASPTGVPILTYGTLPPSDGRVGLPVLTNSAAFTAALAPWLDRGAAFDRIVALFGDAAVEPMAQRLVEDLGRFLDSDRCEPLALHRLAGFAGTLGFRRLAFCIERLSRQDESFCRAADREARWALVIVQAHVRKQRDSTTLV